MSLQKIRYVDELPPDLEAKRTIRSKWHEAVASMTMPAHLGKWAIVDTKPDKVKAQSLASNLRHGNKAFRPYLTETAVRRNAQGKYDVYARILGRKETSDGC